MLGVHGHMRQKNACYLPQHERHLCQKLQAHDVPGEKCDIKKFRRVTILVLGVAGWNASQNVRAVIKARAIVTGGPSCAGTTRHRASTTGKIEAEKYRRQIKNALPFRRQRG